MPTDLEIALAAGGQIANSAGPQDQQTDLQRALAMGGQVVGSMPATQLTEPGRAEALGRGALQGVSLGFSDEIAGAIGSLFSDRPGSYGERYTAIRDESRAANEAAKAAHGGYYLGGELAGGVAGAFIPGAGVAKGASVAAAAGKAALTGGLAGLGSSEADLTKGDFTHAVYDTAKAAAAGAVIGGGLQKLSKAVAAAPAAEREGIIDRIVRGDDGTISGATKTAKKLLVRNEENVLNAASEKFVPEGEQAAITLKDIIGKPAKEVMPVLEERLNQVGSQLDQHYDVVDKITGGVSVQDLVTFLDKEVATLKKSPLNEQYIKAVEDIKNSALEAWAPELGQKLAGNAKALKAGLDSPVFRNMEDVLVPTRDVRAMVTRLQTRGSQVINPLNPGESSIMKQDMGKLLKKFIDEHLAIPPDAAPEFKKAVTAIKEINKTYSGLKTIEKAVMQRGENEVTKTKSMAGHLGSLFGHGGALGAGYALATGHPGAAVASYVIPKLLEKAPSAGRAATAAGVKANSLIQSLTQAAAQGNPWAKAQLAAMGAAAPAATITAGEQL